MARRGDGLVYSTDRGRTCPRCERAIDECNCARTPSRGASGPLRVTLDTKGRRGKTMTVITGLALAADDLAKLGQELRRRCGSGGTVKDGRIEIQGDHVAKVRQELEKRGHPIKA